MSVDRETPVSLWDALDVTEYGPVRDMQVHPVPLPDVVEFCRRWHYTATGGALQWMYGLYDGATLVGVASYAPPTITAAAAVFGDAWRDRVAGMSRLVCAETAPPNVESRLIGGSLWALHAATGMRAVVTYAAQDQGHIGYVYQATNAIYTGTSVVKDYYTDEQGRRWPTYRDGKTLRPEPTWTRHKGLPKHRYVYLLGNKTERKEARALLKLPVLPYPKAVPA